MNETDLLHLLFRRAPIELPDARLFRRNVGRFLTLDGGRFVHVGIEGQSDCYAILRGGMLVEIETKAARGKLREAQLNWQAFCVGWNVPHVVLQARRGATPDAIVTEWIETLRGVFSALSRRMP